MDRLSFVLGVLLLLRSEGVGTVNPAKFNWCISAEENMRLFGEFAIDWPLLIAFLYIWTKQSTLCYRDSGTEHFFIVDERDMHE